MTLPGVLLADDTEIYGTVEIDVQPNVMIIFDTSGSMDTADVVAEPYDPATVYDQTPGYFPNAVYYRQFWRWVMFTLDINNLNCDPIKNELLTKGYATGYIRSASGGFACGGWTSRHLRMGNYMNYEASDAGTPQTRISVAQTVIKQLIMATTNVRLGLMRFNPDQGGRVVAPCGTIQGDLVSAVSSLTANGWTPLAETLAEAGLYFAGMSSWYNSGTYTSPMQQRCQKNYIILMTDGEPTMDSDWRLSSGAYINGDTIGDYDGDGKEPGSMDYVDDVARYLYERDCNPSLGTGTSFERQNIMIYTIGFRSEQQLLQETAANGGGQYYTANNISGLAEAFEEIMASISQVNATFVSPVVPVSRMNRSYAGDRIYVGFFKPMQSGRWLGNIKKYGLGSNGEMRDADGLEATLPDGRIKDNARSYWSFTTDGPDVAAGGAGEVLLEQTSRNLYTSMGTQASLTHADNAFATGNALITSGVLNVGSDTERVDLINDVHGGERFWKMGDILHSEPAVIHYGTDATYIYAGSNGGMIHCLDDYDGSEMWGFIPPDQLGRLSLLLNNNHDYFVDGSPVVYEGSGQKILFFGERRGGNHYYALNVTTVTAPSWLYKISPDILGGENLGQSWCKPEIGGIKTGGGADTVSLMAGGYDTNQDAATPAADTVGRAVFTIRVTDGALSSLNFSAGDMTHCIVDVSGFDSNADGYMNRVYAGDLGGNIWAFEDDDGNGTWSRRKLFSASAVDGVQRKIFYAPDAAAKVYDGSIGEIIFFGTGDRADPGETGVVNRLYAIKNDWEDPATFTTITESDLVDVTEDLIQMGTDEQKVAVAEALANSKGWYIRLENSGEKMVSSPTVFAGAVYFTTYTPDPPDAGVDPDDPCGAPTASGVARLYAVDYLTGASVQDLSEEVETDAGGTVVEYGIKDRSKIIGAAIPSAPVIAVLESGAKMYIGVEGGVAPGDTLPTTDMNIFYWRQIF